jgi:hypothetical protein
VALASVDVDDGIAPAARARGLLLGRSPARRLGLRARITIAFGLGALLLSGVLAGTTYALTRSNLVEQRERAVLRQAYLNAARIQGGLPVVDGTDAAARLGSLQNPTGARPILYQDGSWFAFDAQFGEDALPPARPTG